MNALYRSCPDSSLACLLGRGILIAVVALLSSTHFRMPGVLAQEILIQADTESERSALGDEKGELCVKEINIGPLRKRLATECGLNGASADQWVRHHAESILGAKEASEVVETAVAGDAALTIEGDTLIVTATRQGADRIAKSIERIGQTGIAQVVMRLSVYQGSPAEMQQLKIRWAHVSTSTSIATEQ